MITVDTGCFLALVDVDHAWHQRARLCLPTQQEGWVTTWPVLAQACHMLSRRLDQRFAAWLMDDVAEGNLAVWSPPQARLSRIPELLRQYASLPMDLTDASLVLLAEHLGHGRILSTDERDFGVHRWKRTKPFDNLLAESPD